MDIGFLLKKIITFFVEPLGLIITLFFIGLLLLFLKKYRLSKLSLGASFIFLLLFSYEPFSNALVKNLEEQYPKYAYNADIKYIHVLGSGHNTDKSQPISSNIGDAGIKRVLEGILIHKNISGTKLIFTGYEGDTNTSNAQMNANLAMALGVNKDDIIIGKEPKDTMEEAYFTKNIVGEDAFVLVTSATHMPRSMELFKSLGLNLVAAPSAFYKKEFDGYMKVPNVYSLKNSQMAIHEYIGILWNKLRK
ncbi:MAG TPA: ElyC/SanA/YdcF family protein [Sulfurimonas sp.]|uniref:ElyC/SanA/YdcF family protein n=1 Tax=Sulfurimonas sp. TaxID=2022749 RepID=UPI002CEB5850|nr:ElyC/SanA/YdcF family protein [Sulfurimonas sp.]HUH42181.1 ElyC/SanA/YdcF family protein [Sulfurimonas sp.]